MTSPEGGFVAARLTSTGTSSMRSSSADIVQSAARMRDPSFASLFLSEPSGWSYRDRRADAATEEYESRCESFDRAVCRRRNERGIAIQTLPGELWEINRHARKVQKDVCDRHGVEWKALREALWRLDRSGTIVRRAAAPPKERQRCAT